MLYRINVKGLTPLLTHNLDGSFIDSPEKRELTTLNSKGPKAKKEPAHVERVKELEWHLGLYVGADNKATIPSKVIRGAVWNASKLTKDGQRFNRGARVVPQSISFEYGADDYSSPSISFMARSARFRHESVVTVQRAKILRVRPVFPMWKCSFDIMCDPEMVNDRDLKNWVVAAGRFIGLGDWRPDKGGEFGTFELVSIEESSE